MEQVKVLFLNEYKRIGINLLCYRRTKGLSQEQLAELSGISRSRISDLERGKEDFRISTIMLIAKALEIDYTLLLK